MDSIFQNFQYHPNSLYQLKFNHIQQSLSTPSNENFINNNNNGIQEDPQVECDYFDGVLRYINQMLNEEDIDERPCMFQDCSALQAAEKSFYDALNDHNLSPPPINSYDHHHNDNEVVYDSTAGNNLVQPYGVPDLGEVESLVADHFVGNEQCFPSDSQPCYSSSMQDFVNGLINIPESPDLELNASANKFQANENRVPLLNEFGGNGMGNSSDNFRDKNNHQREENDYPEGGRSTKQLASYTEESQPTETYDKALLCPEMQPNFYHESTPANSSEISVNKSEKWKDCTKASKRGRPRKSEKANKKEVIDVRGLLTRCAHAVSTYDNATANDLLKQIRQHSSPYGDATERLVHYFANALEARVNGTGPALYRAFSGNKVPASDILKAYQTYVTACPFKRMSNIFANKSIAKQIGGCSKVHIIDFGILYGFQWPCIIHGLSLRPGGPPKLRITGIDFPQAGFKPAERIEKTGDRLANYCKRFNVPFEYNAIAKNWDAITLEDLKIDRDEMVVVNCLYRLRHVLDESLTDNSPRDTVMDLIQKIKPDFFVLGVLNGTYNAPFFATRFREALYHFSSLFDMYETTVPREDRDRLLFEREVFGRDVMNIVACESTERIERPETYKQWQVRNQRIGFRQLPLNDAIMKEVRYKVAWYYHKDFLIDQDRNWMLQGWKGRVIYALSCWKPNDK